MCISGMNRRDFLWYTSMVSISSFAMFGQTWGQSPKFIIAETNYGKIRVVDRDRAFRNAEMLLSKLGISRTDVHKIQKLPINQILAAHFEINSDLGNNDLDTLGFAPSVDGVILPQHPFHPTASPVSADIPIIIGSTRTEWTGLTTEAAPGSLSRGRAIPIFRNCRTGRSLTRSIAPP